MDPSEIIFIDESGMNDNDFCPYAYAEMGKRYYESRPGHYKKRISMIGALCKQTFSAPFVFQGHCDTKTFECYVENILAPTLPAGRTIILDNASFHQSQKIKDLIKNAGCKLIYLPPYSPDLNPIEHYWHKIKTLIRKKMRDIKIVLEDAMCDALVEVSMC